MNVGKLFAALIIAVTLLGAFYLGCLISGLLNLLPSPWDVIANIMFGVLGLTAIVYIWIGKLEKKGGSEHGED